MATWMMFSRVLAGPWRRRVCYNTFHRTLSRSSKCFAVQYDHVLTSDRKTIVCVHHERAKVFEDTKPLKSKPLKFDEQRASLSREEVELVKKLRHEDEEFWSVLTLSRLFKVKKGVISKIAPASIERQEQLSKEKAMLYKMKPYRRKLYREQKQMEKQKRLDEILAQNKYGFPSTVSTSSSA